MCLGLASGYIAEKEAAEEKRSCPLTEYCKTQKGDHESCQDMVSRYNAGLLLPPTLANN